MPICMMSFSKTIPELRKINLQNDLLCQSDEHTGGRVGAFLMGR